MKYINLNHDHTKNYLFDLQNLALFTDTKKVDTLTGGALAGPGVAPGRDFRPISLFVFIVARVAFAHKLRKISGGFSR